MRLTDQELKNAMNALQISARLARTAPPSNERADQNKSEGQAFLAANEQKTGVVTLPSGQQYKIATLGHGPKPTLEDRVDCKYRGSLIDGTEFDPGGVVTFVPKASIKGWAEALQLMPAGSTWQLFVPPELAYGERGAVQDPIGPNATLVFNLELLSVSASPTARQASGDSVTRTAQIETQP